MIDVFGDKSCIFEKKEDIPDVLQNSQGNWRREKNGNGIIFVLFEKSELRKQREKQDETDLEMQSAIRWRNEKIQLYQALKQQKDMLQDLGEDLTEVNKQIAELKKDLKK